MIVSGPSTLLPVGVEALGARRVPKVADAVREADVVICLRIQRERLHSFSIPSLREYARYYGVSAKMLEEADPELVLLHPGPVNRGVEIEPTAADGPCSVILDQVENGIAVRMACLYLVSGARKDESELAD